MAQTLEQFGQTIKQKYPQYQDIPDAELGQKMLTKYPQYQDMITTSTPAPAPAQKKSGFNWASLINPMFDPNVQIGGAKEAAKLPFQLQNVGSKAMNLVSKIPGLGFLKGSTPIQTPKALEPTNLTQQVGATGTQIGEYLLPGGLEKGAEVKIAKYIDELPKALKITGTAAKLLTNTLKTAATGAITGLSTAGVTAVQTGGNVEATKSAGKLGFFAGAAGKALELLGPGLAKSLQKADFKLSPMQEAKAPQKIESAASFMTQNKILGSDEAKYNKLKNIYTSFEDNLQNNLPPDVKVSKKTIMETMDNGVESLKTSDPAIYEEARRDVNQAKRILMSQEGDAISVQDALSGKRSWGKKAFGQSKLSVKDPRVVAEGSYAAELAYEKGLTDSLEVADATIKIPDELKPFFGGKTEVTLKEYNKVYGDVITAKNLTYVSQFKKDSGLVGRLFGLWVGESVGQVVAPGLPGKIIGGALGEMASTRIPGVVRNVGERVASMPGSTIPFAAKVKLGTSNNP